MPRLTADEWTRKKLKVKTSDLVESEVSAKYKTEIVRQVRFWMPDWKISSFGDALSISYTLNEKTSEDASEFSRFSKYDVLHKASQAAGVETVRREELFEANKEKLYETLSSGLRKKLETAYQAYRDETLHNPDAQFECKIEVFIYLNSRLERKVSNLIGHECSEDEARRLLERGNDYFQEVYGLKAKVIERGTGQTGWRFTLP